MRACPGCNVHPTPRRIIAASHTQDGELVGVIGLCAGCDMRLRGLPATVREKRLRQIVDKALVDPGRYFATIFEYKDEAILAAALATHDRTGLIVLGWS